MTRRVAIAAEAALKNDHRWEMSAGDLAIEVAKGLLDSGRPPPRTAGGASVPIEAVFVAAPAALQVEGQGNPAAVIADRLGLAGRAAVYALDVGDASGAAALHAAYAHVAAGLSRSALVLAVSKVSDLSERERGALMDTLIDREVEGGLGLSYAALAGLLADLYVQKYGAQAKGVFAHVVAKNAFNAVTGGESFLSAAPTAQEILRDIPVAPPLVRSDFAPLFDGASAVLVADLGLAREIAPAPVEIVSVAGATDATVIADRKDPLRLEAVARAGADALSRAGVRDAGALAYVDVQAACTVLEVLALESLGVTPPGGTGPLFKDGFGRVGSARVVSPGGGAQGRGLAFGAGGVEAAREAFLQLGPGAGKRQVKSGPGDASRALSVSIAGLGGQAFATVFGRPS
jgi:acetyl-CoA C-acetyltransferase